MPIGKNSKGEWVGGGRRHDHPPPLPPSATDAERQERGDPEGRQGWMDRPTPTLAEAFEHVQRLAPEGDRETELALGIISEVLKDKRPPGWSDALDVAVAEANRLISKDRAAAVQEGYAEATEDAARWLEHEVLGPGNMSEWSRMPPYLHGRIRAGEHLARDVGQDPAKEPV